MIRGEMIFFFGFYYVFALWYICFSLSFSLFLLQISNYMVLFYIIIITTLLVERLPLFFSQAVFKNGFKIVLS